MTSRLRVLVLAGVAMGAALSADVGAQGESSARATRAKGVGAPTAAAADTSVQGWRERVYVLLRDNRLLVVDTNSGRIVLRGTLAARSAFRGESGRRLAVSADGRTVFALVAGRRDVVAVVDARTLRVRVRVALASGVRYRALVLAPAGERLYVFGNRAGRVVDTANRLREEAAVVTSVELTSHLLSTATVREADGRSWFVYWSALSADGRRLVVSYHGGCYPEYIKRCAGGADWLDITSGALNRCQAQEFPSSGCGGQVHGMIEPYRNGFIAARGLPSVAVYDRDLRLTRLVQTRLRTHLMDFAISSDVLYALGGCAKGAGLRAVSIRSGTSRRFGPSSLCGQRITVTPRAIVVATTSRNDTSALTVVERLTGRAVQRLNLGSDPLDVVAG